MTNSKPSDFTYADFELNDRVVKRVSDTLRRMGNHTAANWLVSQINELGLPMIVNNTSTTFHRIQKYWRTATFAYPCIRHSCLVSRGFRNGDRSMPFHITNQEAYNPEAHAAAAMRAISSPSPVRPLDRPMFLNNEMQDNPILHPGCPRHGFYPPLPPEPQSVEPVIKREETPAAPTVDVSYSATIKTPGGTQVVHFTSATKDDVTKTVEAYVQCCRQGNTIEYSTFALVRDFVVKNMGVGSN